MFLVDTAQGRIVDDDEIKADAGRRAPLRASGSTQGLVELADLPEREHVVFSHDSVLRRQQVFGYTHEELKIIVAPMAKAGAEPIGSMGTDTPIAVLSERPRLLFDYFQQLFAQVTNPPLDAIREELVTALGSTVGPEGEPAAARAGQLPPGRAAVPDHRQRRAGQDHPRRRRRRPRRISSPRVVSGPVPGGRAAAWRCKRALDAHPHAGQPGDRRRAPASSCCPTATPTSVDAPIPSLLLTAPCTTT